MTYLFSLPRRKERKKKVFANIKKDRITLLLLLSHCNYKPDHNEKQEFRLLHKQPLEIARITFKLKDGKNPFLQNVSFLKQDSSKTNFRIVTQCGNTVKEICSKSI